MPTPSHPIACRPLSQVLAGCDRATTWSSSYSRWRGWSRLRRRRGHAPVDAVAHTLQRAGRVGTGRTGARSDSTGRRGHGGFGGGADVAGGTGAQSGGQRPALQSRGRAQIQVHWRQDGTSSACLEVHDSGPGLKEADAARLGSASFACWAQGPAAAPWAGHRAAHCPGARRHGAHAAKRGPRGLQVSGFAGHWRHKIPSLRTRRAAQQ